MKVRRLTPRLEQKLKKLNLEAQYKKALRLFEANHRHPSLHYEVMQETKKLNPVLRSFRINKKYRAEGYELGSEFCVINISNHYRD